jgi:hypothetical protein
MTTAAWGLSFTSSGPANDIPITQQIFSFFVDLYDYVFDRSHNIAEKNLLRDLNMVRKEVKKEAQWFREGCVLRYVNDMDCLEAKRKRMLFLFIKDLMKGVGGTVLNNKDSCDNTRTKKVTAASKRMAWIFVVFLNAGMLFYVYLFARTQTSSRQSAWLISFLIWFVFEIAVSSTAVVLFTHLIIPLYVLSDIRTIKKKVLKDILTFRKASFQGQGRRTGAAVVTSNDSLTEFNSAKYLYSSWRVASLFPSLKESELILSFHTPWPQHSLKTQTTTVHSSYERRYSFVYQAIGRVGIFFLASFLNLPQLARDSFVQMTSNSGLGYFGILFLRLYGLSPYLLCVPVIFAVIIVHFGLSWTLRSERIKRAQDLYPIEEEFSSVIVAPQNPQEEKGEEDEEAAVDLTPTAPLPAATKQQQKIAEGRKMSQLMVHSLHQDMIARRAVQGLHEDMIARRAETNHPHVDISAFVASSLAELNENLDPSFWSDSDEDNNQSEKDKFQIDSPSIELQEFDRSVSPPASSQGSGSGNIVWEDDDSSLPLDDSINDSNVSIDFWDEDDECAVASDSLQSSEYSLPSNEDDSLASL